jgi:BASS family bile acid:Na+ symporter
MAVTARLPSLSAAVQPWIARLANVALYSTLAATLLGYWPNMMGIAGGGAILAALGLVLGAFGIGYLLGGREDPLHDVGGLGTAQRNTAAALTVAAQNFDDRDVLVMVTVVSTLGMVVLLFLASRIRRDNVKRVVEA